jgi:hypothetical protein
MATSKRPATEERDRLRQRVTDRRARVAELEAERSRARRSLDRALVPLRALYEQAGEAGRDPDPAVEAELLAAATAARATVSIRPSLSHGKISDIEIVDERVEYLLVGARRALESTEAELSAFEHDHAAELLAELLPTLIESRDRFVNALIELSAADADLAGRASMVAALGRRTGLFGVDALPRLPLSMDARQEMAQAARQVAEDADALIMVPAGMVA